MKGFTLRQPWASLWLHGIKQYETRGYRLSYRGLVAVHASSRLHDDDVQVVADYPEFEIALSEIGQTMQTLPLGAILGVVRIVACEPTEKVLPLISDRESIFGNYAAGRFAFRTETVEIFPEPIPIRGQLGLWEWTPPAEWLERHPAPTPLPSLLDLMEATS